MLRKKVPGWVAEAIVATVFTFLGALALMFGMAHAHSIWPSVPAIGYSDSFFLLLWTDVVINAVLFGVRVKLLDD